MKKNYNVLYDRIMAAYFRERTGKGLSEQVSFKLSIAGSVRVKEESSILGGGNSTKP